MVLAAGRGTRMAPLSSVIPKPALEVLGRPLLASALAHLRRAGCGRTVVNLHLHPERVTAAARGCDADVCFSWEPELLGGAGGLAAARELLGAGPVLAANADIWADLDLTPLSATGDPGTVTLALQPHPDPARWGSVVLDPRGRVVEFLAAGAHHDGERFLFTGFQVLGADVIAALSEPPAEMKTLWEGARRGGDLRGVVVTGSWSEVGAPDAYLRLIGGMLAQTAWIHPQAEVSADARVARSAVGAGCRIGAGALVEDSVMTAGAAAADGAELRHCVAAGAVTAAGSNSGMVIVPGASHPLP